MTYQCKYCNKAYVKESTLAAHLCETKRRWQQQNESGVQLGLNSFLSFYEYTQGSAKLKTYEDFVKSSFYGAFVRYGRYLIDIRCVNIKSFTDWLLKNNKKLDFWCKENLYLEWLHSYIRKESVHDAIERAIKEMNNLAEQDEKLQGNFVNYFSSAAGNRICKHIIDGRISPWIVYNCQTGVEWLSQITHEQLQIIMPVIDPEFWHKKFTDYLEDVKWCKHILKKAGL